MMKMDVHPGTGEMRVDPGFFPHFDGMRPHQTRLEGGDASSDSYCYA
jgi:selenium-binding protein 1